MRGDVNKDQIINILDAINILFFVLEYEEATVEDICAADMDYDNELTVADVLRVVDIILGRP